VPVPLVDRLGGLVPSGRVLGVQPGDSLDLGRARLDVVPAVHGVEVRDAYSRGPVHEASPFVGYVIRHDVTLYHSGDTVLDDDLVRTLGRMDIDVALLPINGRDYFRERDGFVGNLTPREAVTLADEIGARVLVPMHYDAIAGNVERAAAAIDAAHLLNVSVHVLFLARGVGFGLCDSSVGRA
jgi:L-ascorbate metabolism protein UlaG (beta-lactamase superfamily)